MEDPPSLCFPHWELISSACCVFMWAVRCTHVSSCAWWNLLPTSNPTTSRLNNVWTVDISEEAKTRKDALSGWLSMELFFFIKAHTTQNSLHLQFFPQIIRVSTLTTSSTEMRKVPQLVLFLVPKSCRRNLPFVRSTKTQPALASQSAWQSSFVCPFPTCWRWEGEPLFLCVDFKIHLFAWCCKKRAKCVVFLEMLRFYLHILLNMGATWDIW